MDRGLARATGGLTLIELLIAMILFSAIALGFYSVDTFSRRQVVTSDRQAVVQNEVSIALDHMTKTITQAIGSTVIAGQSPWDFNLISGDAGFKIYADVADDGVSPGNGVRDAGAPDRWKAYRWRNGGAPAADRYQIWYYADYEGSPADYEIIARRISNIIIAAGENYITLTVSGCWVPSAACGTMQNPQVTMQATAKMPSVSTN